MKRCIILAVTKCEYRPVDFIRVYFIARPGEAVSHKLTTAQDYLKEARTHQRTGRLQSELVWFRPAAWAMF